jgi:hypothetical protein
MPSIYHIGQSGRELMTDVGTVEAVEGAIRAGKPGRYHIDRISAEPLPSGHTSRRWGVEINRRDRSVTLDLDPWPDR